MSDHTVPSAPTRGSVTGGQRSRAAGTSPHTPILWIDHDIGPDNAEVRLLKLEGIEVSCAQTAARGLALARSGSYRGIVLDLRLPDASGLAVLAKLRSDGLATPVLMLTGSGDFESARVAGYLGAMGFKTKPLLGDELVLAVRTLLETVPAMGGRSSTGVARSAEPAGPQAACLETLLESLRRLRHTPTHPRHPSRDYGLKTAKTMLATALIRALTDAALQTPVFFACAAALRQALTTDPQLAPAELAAETENRLVEILRTPHAVDSRVATALALIEADLANHHRPAEEEIARTIHVDRAHLGRLIHTQTGFTFREWRKGLFLKAGIAHLAASTEHVGQIACRILGYRHESQFDREFHEAFGIAPREFRRVWHACRSQFPESSEGASSAERVPINRKRPKQVR
jgi:ActR/RegA family two-component response regulator/AraC-like DNA-binding protein